MSELKNEKRKFYRATISAEDFSEAGSYLDAIDSETPEKLRHAAIFSAIVAYCRPFCKSRQGNSSIKIHILPESFLNENELTLHTKLLEWRCAAIAHSDFDYRKTVILQESESSYSFIAVQSAHYIDQIDIPAFSSLIEKFRQKALIDAYEMKKIIGSINTVL